MQIEPAMQPQPPAESDRTTRIATVPNLLCALRFLGAIILPFLAIAGHASAFLWLFLLLAMSDWIDGKLAILLRQKSVLGARLDSWADAALYSALLFGSLWLRGDLLWEEWPWILAAGGSYAIATVVGLRKFGRWPSYHTRAAKTCWLLITVSAAWALYDSTAWPLRLTMLAVVATNLESMLITRVSDSWNTNVPSLYHAMQRRRQT